jgi:hypothetical protein
MAEEEASSVSMLDFASALGGAPGGPPGAGPPGPPDGGPPGPPDGPQSGGEQFTDSLDALSAAEDALHNADRAVAAQCLQNVLKLKASNQQDSRQGGIKSLQRALAGGGGGPVG